MMDLRQALTRRPNRAPDTFLNPRCSPATLDVFVPRKSILLELEKRIPLFTGKLLDIGCGRMPYRDLILSKAAGLDEYIGLDIQHPNYPFTPDLFWDGERVPVLDDSIDCAIAIEVLEHCPEPKTVLREANRVIKPRGFLFLTVPFLWPLHDVPWDEYRYTPFSLERHLLEAGFSNPYVSALGGWDRSFAQMLALWAKRKPRGRMARRILPAVASPLVRYLDARDSPPPNFEHDGMITALSALAYKE